jgi:S-adenosylmethionine:tRNA ribosyltransferase-isomerase
MSISPAEFKYKLPKNLIASVPTKFRDHCRLMMLDRQTGLVNHGHFYDLIDHLTGNDVLVLNQSKVFPARIFGKKETGGKVELLLLRPVDNFIWTAISKPGLKVNTKLIFPGNLSGIVISRITNTGEVDIKFNQEKNKLLKTLDKIGHTPIPPYIDSNESETDLRRDYQTVFAKDVGSAAAPTAGLHFTPELLAKVINKGVQIEYITLHVGLGTFQSLRPENIAAKKLHSEYFEIKKEVLSRLNQAKESGKRIIAVGTTTARALETSSNTNSTDIFIFPPYKFKFIDSLITNFHLPESSLLMLVSAFISHPNTPFNFTDFLSSSIGCAYSEAIKKKYHFFSFGDACWIY